MYPDNTLSAQGHPKKVPMSHVPCRTSRRHLADRLNVDVRYMTSSGSPCKGYPMEDLPWAYNTGLFWDVALRHGENKHIYQKEPSESVSFEVE